MVVRVKKRISLRDFCILTTITFGISGYFWWIPTLQDVEIERRRRRKEAEKKCIEQGLDPDKELGEFLPPPRYLFLRAFPDQDESEAKSSPAQNQKS